MDNSLEIRRDEGVLEVHLVRPQSRNMIDEATTLELTELIVGTNIDASVRAILITGHADDFCTGAQGALKSHETGAQNPFDYRWTTKPVYDLTQALWDVEKPVVSAVNGTVAGIGWMVALLADIVVAAPDARWTHVFARRGMVPHGGDTYYLPRILPFRQLMELALLSDTVTSEQLHAMGAINRLAPKDELLDAAREIAQRLASGPTRSLAAAKRLYRNSLDHDLRTAFAEERDALALLSQTHDRKEGMRSFLEKRPPNFIGE